MDTRIGPFTVMEAEGRLLMTLKGDTWEEVTEDSCTCAKFWKTDSCDHVEALIRQRNQGHRSETHFESPRASTGLKRASRAQPVASPRAQDFQSLLLLGPRTQVAIYGTRVLSSYALKALSIILLWMSIAVAFMAEQIKPRSE